MDTDIEPTTLRTALRCARCRYTCEHPGPVRPSDLGRYCPLCGAMLGAVTVYRLSGESRAAQDETGAWSSNGRLPGIID
jgi:hypothetical protein